MSKLIVSNVKFTCKVPNHQKNIVLAFYETETVD